jgi:hypothetical protein
MIADIGKTYLRGIPHEGKQISFEYPAYRGGYGDVAENIDNAGLKKPFSQEIASLLYDSWRNPNGEYESKIINIPINDGILEFSGNLYVPRSNKEVSGGLIIENNPKIANGRLVMNEDSLVKRLEENDPLVKFVPFGFKMGKQLPGELEKNPYIIAKYGEEGAHKLAEISSRYKLLPYVSPLSPFKEMRGTKPRMSVIHDSFGKGLYIFCEWGIKDICHSFGRVEEEK